nr:ATP-binding protein [Geobacillus sp. 47C-IIb]
MRECRCRYDRQITNKLKSAKVPLDFIDATVSSFKTDIYKMQESQERAKTAKEVAIKYVNNYREFKDLGKGLYLFSETKGSGKTRLAVSILNALIKKYDIRGLYISSTDLLHEIKKTFDDSNHSAYEIIQQFTEAQLLVIDDFGVEKTTDWSEEMFTKILDDRMIRGRRLLLLTLKSINCQKKYRAGRIESRVEKMTFPVPLPDESVRSYLAQQENECIAEFIFSF